MPVPPDLVLFDFDGVIADYARPRRIAALAMACGCAPERMHRVLFEEGLEAAYDSGRLDTATYLTQLSEATDRPVDTATWVAARVAGTRIRPAVVEMIRMLSGHVGVAVLTNNGPLIEAVVRTIAPGLFPLLDGRVLASGMLGLRKPAPGVYRRALAMLDADPARTLFVDDLFVNVRGARACGLQADTVRDARSLRRLLLRHCLTP